MLLLGAHLRLFLTHIQGGCGGIIKPSIAILITVLFLFVPARAGDLVVDRNFATADGLPVLHLVRWDRAAWHNLGGGVSGSYSDVVLALGEYNNRIIVAGQLEMAGDFSARNIFTGDSGDGPVRGEGIDSEVE